MKKFLCLIAVMIVSVSAFAADSGPTYYHCYAHECVQIPNGEAEQPVNLAELQAAQDASLFVLPVGSCQTTSVLPDGTVIVACGVSAVSEALPLSLDGGGSTEACSSVHGAGSCCRIVVSETYNKDATPIERIVCG